MILRLASVECFVLHVLSYSLWRKISYTNISDKFLKKELIHVAFWVPTMCIHWIFAKLFVCRLVSCNHQATQECVLWGKKTTKYKTTTAWLCVCACEGCTDITFNRTKNVLFFFPFLTFMMDSRMPLHK